jgi:hypothetical protein
VICRAWPGFSVNLLIHLVDFVLAIEEKVVAEGTMDSSSARKLFFLSSWIRLLLSQRFVVALDYSFRIDEKGGDSFNSELTLATLEQLNYLGYPLNSLFDRCRDCNEDQHKDSHGDGSNNTHHRPTEDLRKTSRDILQSLEEILGSEQIRKFGYQEESITGFIDASDNSVVIEETVEDLDNKISSSTVNPCVQGSTSKMSLDEMEALLAENPEPQDDATQPLLNVDGDKNSLPATGKAKSVSTTEYETARPAWVRCKVWDPCALGTLPGYPT